jgi:Fe-S-cluster containining protein
VPSRFPIRGDQELIQIVDAGLADVRRRSGDWLTCRPGCTQCCVGVFAINQLDAARLQRGLRKLEAEAPERGAAVRQRARDAVSRLSENFPGDLATGILGDSEACIEAFENFSNDEPCPALDPQSGLCELYDSRPMTCRVFGPPVRSEGGLGVCELCFPGASDEEIAACEMVADPEHLEETVLAEVEKAGRKHGETIIAFCLAE